MWRKRVVKQSSLVSTVEGSDTRGKTIMRVSKRMASVAAACVLAASAIGLGAAAPAQAGTSADCNPPQPGNICLHVRYSDGTYHWWGPYYECQIVNIPWYDNLTWVSDNQYNQAVTRFYDLPNGGGDYLGGVVAPYDGRPPGYQDSVTSPTQSVRTC
jgi:hypothetical protein